MDHSHNMSCYVWTQPDFQMKFLSFYSYQQSKYILGQIKRLSQDLWINLHIIELVC